MENSLSTMSLDTLVNKLIDLSVSFGSKLLVALLVFFIGRWIVKKLNRLVITYLRNGMSKLHWPLLPRVW